MKRVGLTGGIGSGKSTVASIFEQLDIPVYFADDRGKYLLDHDLELKDAVRAAFGEEVYPEGKLDRKVLGAVVFSDPEKLTQLNALVHPAVGRDYRAWCEATATEDVPYTIKEAAILFETGGYTEMDVNLVVTAPEEMRIARVMARDEVDEEAVRARMERQWPEGDKVMLADYVIVNDGEHSLIEQVMALHRELSQ
jgi:dephospho-CoA kinase